MRKNTNLFRKNNVAILKRFSILRLDNVLYNSLLTLNVHVVCRIYKSTKSFICSFSSLSCDESCKKRNYSKELLEKSRSSSRKINFFVSFSLMNIYKKLDYNETLYCESMKFILRTINTRDKYQKSTQTSQIN